MVSKFIPLAFFVFFSPMLTAQNSFFVGYGCSVNDDEMGKRYTVSEPSPEAKQIIDIIMGKISLSSRFTIMSANVSNAIATEINDNRYILYNNEYIDRIIKSDGKDWAAFFVFAHEIGHHLNNHKFDAKDPAKRKEQELEADVFAGSILYLLGATLQEAKIGAQSVCKELESHSHPSRSARIAAVANGWQKSKENTGGIQPKPVVIPKLSFKTPPPPPNTTVRLPIPPKEVPVQRSNRPAYMQQIKGGTYNMGSFNLGPDEKPVHQVTISTFYLSKYEVTVEEYLQFVKETNSHHPQWLEPNSNFNIYTGNDDHYKQLQWGLEGAKYPIVGVSWYDAVAYCEWLSQKTGYNFRLPTEAEWEYAAGNGSKHTQYSWGNAYPTGKAGGSVADQTGANQFNWEKTEVAIFVKYTDEYFATAPVGSFNANDFGLYDMTGNVREWCSDWRGNYLSTPQTDPKGAETGTYKVTRGGSWHNNPQFCNTAYRFSLSPGNRNFYTGFRIACSE